MTFKKLLTAAMASSVLALAASGAMAKGAKIFVIGGKGLALSTSLCGMLQFGWCLSLIQKQIGRLPWWSLVSTSLRAFVASGAMMAVGWWVLNHLRGGDVSQHRLMNLTVALIASLMSYALLASVLRLDEFWMLLHRSKHDASSGRTTILVTQSGG